MRLRPCFLAVNRTMSYVPKSFGPCTGRNPPEIFVRGPIVHRSCFATIAVKCTPVIQEALRTSQLASLPKRPADCSGSSPSWWPWSVRNRNATR